jgi:hypothetical protein
MVIGFGLLASLAVAYWIGTQQTLMVVLFTVLVLVTISTAGLRHRAWLLIPFTWTLTGTSGSLPFSLSFHDVGILLAFCAYIFYYVLTHKTARQKFHPLDWLLALNVVWLGVTFIRHPVGLHVLGSETMGARPYFNLLLALLAYRVILRQPDSEKIVSRVPYFILAGTVITALVNIIVYISPAATPYVYQFYSGVDIGGYLVSPVRDSVLTRWEGLWPLGLTIVLVLCSAYPPRTLFNPTRLRFYLFCLGLAAILASGFRNVMLWALAALVLGSWLHRGWREVVLGTIAATLFLGALLIGQGRVYQLPLTAQRTLSFLPGKWSPVAADAGEESSESRFEWWRKIIKENLIQDWWLGDGIGVSERDYDISVSQGMTVSMFDWFTITGSYHNGPLTTIHYAGILELVFFYAYMIAAAIYSVKCVDRCRGSPLFMVAVFLAIQLLWWPVHFAFVFGDFSGQISEHIFLVGLLLLLWRMSGRMTSSPNQPRGARPRFQNNRDTPVAA